MEVSSALHRRIGWKDAFWLTTGVPALVLFSIGGVAATVGTLSWLVWMLSVSIGFLQAFTYVELAGLFPSKSGGISIYGAAAWARYAKFIAPFSVWCNWLSWMPVLAIGSGLAAGYIQNTFFSSQSVINTWEIEILSLDFINQGLALRLNSTFVIGAILLSCVYMIQHRGISNAAKFQMIVGLAVILPLLIVGIVPFFNGNVVTANLVPLVPINGAWNKDGWTLFLGGMFIAAWSAYAFEASVCYTAEFKNPSKDTPRAIFSAGILCLVIYSLVPTAFQGSLGLEGMSDEGIVDGSAVGKSMARIIGGGETIGVFVNVMLVLALLLAIMTSMAGISRSSYQGSVDGWLPKYLSKTNKHGAPINAMRTDFGASLLLLMMNDYLFILAVSNCCYLVFNFLNLNAGWIHRIDNAKVFRPWKAPGIMIGIGAVLSFVNMVFLGAGANVWGEGTLRSAILAIMLIIPIFAFRHYVTDKGQFPPQMFDDLRVNGAVGTEKLAGYKPYLALAAGILIVFLSNQLFQH